MPAFTATAPGKIILFGEHAVVYGEPALAVPVSALQARAVVTADITGPKGRVWIDAPDIGLSSALDDLEREHPLRAAAELVLGEKDPGQTPACKIKITSTIPSSSGLGSSAAISAALIQAFSAFLGNRLSPSEISALTFEVEKIHHGTPSGIDNSVVVYKQPVFYQQGKPIEFLEIKKTFEILIADSGETGSTYQAVNAVRQQWEADPEAWEKVFSSMGDISRNARDLLNAGRSRELGPLLTDNQKLLQMLGVSSPKLDRLAEAALEAGAEGAKLSGGGLGGHLIVQPGTDSQSVIQALQLAGAANVLTTKIGL